MKLSAFVAAAILLLVMVACTVMGPEQTVAVRSALQPLVDNGSLTQAQVEAIIASLSGGQIDWETLLAGAGSAAVAIIGAILGVDIRGKILARRVPATVVVTPPAQP